MDDRNWFVIYPMTGEMMWVNIDELQNPGEYGNNKIVLKNAADGN